MEACSQAVALQMPSGGSLNEAAAAIHSAQQNPDTAHLFPYNPIMDLIAKTAEAEAAAHSNDGQIIQADWGGSTWNQVGGGEAGLRRKKRSGNAVEEANRRRLMADYTDFRWSMATKLGNLSCVMSQMQMLDEAGNINLDHFMMVEGRVWGGGSDPKSAASDPLFVTKLKEGFLDCYNVAQAWPQAALDRNPLYQKYGRHMIFFNCATKVEEQMCTKYLARQWLEQLYGRLDEELLGVLGPEVAADPYEAAAMVMRLKYETASPEEELVDKFFWGQPDIE